MDSNKAIEAVKQLRQKQLKRAEQDRLAIIDSTTLAIEQLPKRNNFKNGQKKEKVAKTQEEKEEMSESDEERSRSTVESVPTNAPWSPPPSVKTVSHSKSKKTCPFCGHVLANKFSLGRHISKVHADETLGAAEKMPEQTQKEQSTQKSLEQPTLLGAANLYQYMDGCKLLYFTPVKNTLK